MALTLSSPVVGMFDPTTRDQASMARKLALAVLGAGTAAQRQTARAELLQRPDFVATARTTDNTAASEVIDLDTEGVTWPAATVRKVRFRSRTRNGADTFMQEWEQYVLGGTTPVLLGSPRLINAVASLNGVGKQYGRVRVSASFSTTTATNTARASLGTTVGNTTSGVATITHPIARAGTKVLSVTAYTDDQTNTTHRQAAIEPGVSSTTALLSLLAEGLTSNTGVVADFAANGFVDAELEILPPPSIALAVTSNHVEVHCGYDATDNVYHDVEVFIGKAEFATLAAD